jgi:hypothetical protein
VDRMADEGWEVVEHTQRLWTMDCIISRAGQSTVAKKPRRICQEIRESDAFTHSTRSLCKVTARCRDLSSTHC